MNMSLSYSSASNPSAQEHACVRSALDLVLSMSSQPIRRPTLLRNVGGAVIHEIADYGAGGRSDWRGGV